MVPPDSRPSPEPEQNDEMRFIAAAIGSILLLGACTGRQESLPRPSRAYCETAYRYEQRIQHKPRPSVETQLAMLTKMADHAPKDIAPDMAVFLDAMRRVEAEPSLKDAPRVVTAVDNVNRRTSSGCGFFEQDRSTGF
jgi:hypothetical protein